MRQKFVEAGEIVTTHGVRGEVKVLPWLDSAEDLREFDRVRVGQTDFRVENCRVQKTCNLLKLYGIDTVEAAQALRGKTVYIYRDDVSDDIIFASELIGVQVYAGDTCIGNIAEVLDYPGNKVYVVKGEYTYMVPAVSAFVISTDMQANRMQVKIIEGMRTDED